MPCLSGHMISKGQSVSYTCWANIRIDELNYIAHFLLYHIQMRFKIILIMWVRSDTSIWESASSHHQSISDLTQLMNVADACIRTDHHTGNSVPYEGHPNQWNLPDRCRARNMELKIFGCFLRVGRIGRVPTLEYQMPRHHLHVSNTHPSWPLVNSCWEMASLLLIFKAFRKNPRMCS